jgi:hypothetical protein
MNYRKNIHTGRITVDPQQGSLCGRIEFISFIAPEASSSIQVLEAETRSPVLTYRGAG